jgi:hypothetical protein
MWAAAISLLSNEKDFPALDACRIQLSTNRAHIIQPEDLQFKTTLVASFAWLAAEGDEKFAK